RTRDAQLGVAASRITMKCSAVGGRAPRSHERWRARVLKRWRAGAPQMISNKQGSLMHGRCLTPRHEAPPVGAPSIVKLLPMSPHESVTYVPGPYPLPPNSTMQRAGTHKVLARVLKRPRAVAELGS